jgi:hypothetical protein
MKDSIIAFKAASVKVPAKKDEIFMKGIVKFNKYLISSMATLCLTLGSYDSEAQCLSTNRQISLYRNKLANYERMLIDLLWMFND